MPFYQLGDEIVFPAPQLAGAEGLLAVGGDLTFDRLLLAYQNGIFPWYEEGSPILWWAPDPRFVLFPEEIRISKSMRQVLKKQLFTFTINKDFEAVIEACQNISRNGQDATWITDEMKEAYIDLHRKGWGYSVEVWQNAELVGGLYGVLVGKVFCGESMFTRTSNASKAALIFWAEKLQKAGVELIDCQVHSDHLESMGARYISLENYLEILRGV